MKTRIEISYEETLILSKIFLKANYTYPNDMIFLSPIPLCTSYFLIISLSTLEK